MKCSGGSVACRGGTKRPYLPGLRRDVVLLCDDCASVLSSMGLRLIERRVEARAVAQDRRRLFPAWLRAGHVARDLTGARR